MTRVIACMATLNASHFGHENFVSNADAEPMAPEDVANVMQTAPWIHDSARAASHMLASCNRYRAAKMDAIKRLRS